MRKSTIFLLPLLLFGCAQAQVNNRLQAIEIAIRPLVGVATKEMIATQYGIPARKTQLGTLEVWEYRQSFGSRSSGNAYVNPYNPYAVSAAGRQWESYDKVTFTFGKDGILQSFKSYVQR